MENREEKYYLQAWVLKSGCRYVTATQIELKIKDKNDVCID